MNSALSILLRAAVLVCIGALLGVGVFFFALQLPHLESLRVLESSSWTASRWKGVPCWVERRLLRMDDLKSEWTPGWSRWIPGACPEEISLNGAVGDCELTALSIKQLGGVETLALMYVDNLTPEFFSYLGEMRSVESLLLDESRFDDSMSSVLAHFPNIRSLSVRGTALSGNTLPLMEKIEIFDGTNCPITDEGVARLAQCRQLKRVCLAGTKVSVNGAKSLVLLPMLSELVLPEGGEFDKIMDEVNSRK